MSLSRPFARFASGPAAGAVLVALAAVGLAAPAAQAAPACPAGKAIYATAALKLVAGRGHTPTLTVCRPASQKRSTVKLPADAASIVRAQAFDTTVAVLLTRDKAAGGGIEVVNLSTTGKVDGPPVVVTGAEVENLLVRGFAVAPHVPYVAVSMSGGLVKTFQIAHDGSTTPFGQAQAYARVNQTSLRLDPAHHRVRWIPDYKGSSAVFASLLASPGCNLGGTTIKATAAIRVYKVHEEYWACEMATGKVTNLSAPNVDHFHYDDPGPPEQIQIAGHFVLYEFSLGFDPDVVENFFMVADVASARVTTPGVSSPSDTDIVENSGDGSAGAVVLTDTGTIALIDWVFDGDAKQQAVICPSLPVPDLLRGKEHNEWVLLVIPFGGEKRSLDCQADPVIEKTTNDPRTPTIANLALDGHTLSWTSLGLPRTAQVE